MALQRWLAVVALTLATSDAVADVVVFLTESGPDVVATASGSFDLSLLSTSGAGGQIGTLTFPSGAHFVIGGGPGGAGQQGIIYNLQTPFPTYGSGNVTGVNTRSGFLVGAVGNQLWIGLSPNYTSNVAFDSTATWSNQTLASLGVTPGTYVASSGPGGTGQTFTLIAAVPEASPALLLGVVSLCGGAVAIGRKTVWRGR